MYKNKISFVIFVSLCTWLLKTICYDKYSLKYLFFNNICKSLHKGLTENVRYSICFSNFFFGTIGNKHIWKLMHNPDDNNITAHFGRRKKQMLKATQQSFHQYFDCYRALNLILNPKIVPIVESKTSNPYKHRVVRY